MKLLVAKKVEDGTPRDFNFVPDGEIVHECMLVCCNSEHCGCNRALAGVVTHKSTTTAEVVELPITEEDLADIAAKCGAETGWGEELTRERLDSTIAAIEEIPVGSLVRVDYDHDNEVWEYRFDEKEEVQ